LLIGIRQLRYFGFLVEAYFTRFCVPISTFLRNCQVARTKMIILFIANPFLVRSGFPPKNFAYNIIAFFKTLYNAPAKIFERNSLIVAFAKFGEFGGNALPDGFGLLFIEFDIAGLATDDVQGEPGAFTDFSRKHFTREVEALIPVREDEDGKIPFESIDNGFHLFASFHNKRCGLGDAIAGYTDRSGAGGGGGADERWRGGRGGVEEEIGLIAMPGDIAISTQALVKRFKGRRGMITALDSISLEVKRGETFGLIGPDGAFLCVRRPHPRTGG
jgi:hypothetical protein